ncbi:MAG TPA: SCO family protein [Methylococcaceae bacterium]|nr:SCO family protein [Methylococcaceae bacterium]
MSTHGILRPMKTMAFMLLLAVAGPIPGGGSTWAAPPGSPWGAAYFPNIPLTTQDGKTVRFYDDLIKDKVVAINFIYTQCGDVCPMETANLRRVQKELGERVGRDIFLVSISVDPERDTPQALKEYAGKFKAGPGWTFATGKKDDIKRLRQKLGLYREEAGGEKLNQHHTSFLVGNEATGRWMKRSPFDNPKVLAWLLGQSLPSYRVDGPQRASYAEAPRLPDLPKAEDIYRSRCLACHSLGKEDGIGPGLAGVAQKRDRAWLARWLKAPDRLLAEKDPIALELFARYKNLPMPNFKLDDAEVEALIGYLENPTLTSVAKKAKPPAAP